MDAPPALDRLDRRAAGVVSFLACVYGAMVLATMIFGILELTTNAEVELVQPVTAELTAATEPGGRGSALAAGEYVMAEIVVAGPPVSARVLFTASVIVQALMHLAVVAAVVALCQLLLRNRPFAPTMHRMLVIVALALIVGGMLGTALHGFGNLEVAAALADPRFPMQANLDFTPAIIGVLLGLVAGAFKFGERLQRDTEGLV